MSMFVNTNVSALNAQRQLFNSSNSLNTSFERLSSGFRINRAADDAAGLQITDRMTSQINGLNQAVRNANDGISLVQTAEGALGETTNALQRIRQLAVQSQNGTNTAADREALQKETTALLTEISRIAQTTQFNDQNILAGFTANFQVGTESGQDITVDLTNANLTNSATGLNATGLGIAGINLDTAGGSAIGLIDTAISTIGEIRADLGAIQNRFQSTIRNLNNVVENTSSARSRILDTDFATETAELTRNQIIQQASMTILSQANQRPQGALQLLG